MTMSLHSQNRKSNYRKVFEATLRLPLDEQRRLREELATVSEVYLVSPAHTKEAQQKGRALAEQVRTELAASKMPGSLDETMHRGRA